MKTTWTLAGVLLCAGLAVPVALGLIFSEAEDVPPSSLEYWLAVPDPIKRVPVISPCRPSRFSHAKARAEGSARSVLHYGTRVSAAHVTDVIADHFELDGCLRGPSAPSVTGLICPDGQQVEIEVTEGPACRGVRVEITEG